MEILEWCLSERSEAESEADMPFPSQQVQKVSVAISKAALWIGQVFKSDTGRRMQ